MPSISMIDVIFFVCFLQGDVCSDIFAQLLKFRWVFL